VSSLVRPGCDQDALLYGFGRAAGFCEGGLPAPVREALRLAREARPQHRLRCLAFHSDENGREVARLGLTSAAGLRPKDVMVLAVAVTEVVSEDVRTVSHTLVIKVEAVS
jgi:hypothetical protein